MARAQTKLSEQEKKALRDFCKDNGLTEADLLRRMIRQILGDRVVKEDDKAPKIVKEGSNNFTLRLTGREIRMIEKRAEKEGFTFRTTWAVAVIRQALSSDPILTHDEIQSLRDSNRELAAIGRNLNQVAHSINIDYRNSEKFTPELFDALNEHISDHRSKVAAVLDASVNRWGVSDG